MRVLHLHSGNQYGGIERLLVTLAQTRADAPGIEHAFGLCFRGRLLGELLAEGAPVTVFGPARLSRPDTILRVRRAARLAIAEFAPAIVVTHLPWSLVVFGPALRELAGGRRVHWVHGCQQNPSWLERLAARHVPDACLFNSEFTAAACEGRYPGVFSRVVYPPVRLATPEEPRESVRHRLATDPRDVVVVQTSRMEAWKGHLDLIDAAARIPADIPWIIWFAGGAQTVAQKRYYERLQAHVARSGVAMRVRFLGELTDVSSVLHASDIFCQPNEVPEPFGIAFVEAMSAGLPVVATAIGAAPELVTESSGILVGAHDPAALAAALQTYLTNPQRRADTGARGRARALTLAHPADRLAELTRFLADVRGAA
jgi:glycosyltransferase involved in cell wall biosynthesis